MKAFVVTDLGFGDSGKGSITDYLCRKNNIGTVIRYNGGPQAGHNVIEEDGREHTFSQFGSGTFVNGVQTYLSKYMLINPLTHLNEEKHLYNIGIRDAFARLSIHKDAIIISPFHKLMNQIKETNRGDDRHGSCGHGVGEAQSFALEYRDATLFAKDLFDKKLMKFVLKAQQQILIEKLLNMGFNNSDFEVSKMKSEVIDEIIDSYYEYVLKVFVDDGKWLDSILKEQNIVFEGAQGILLDETYGFHPYTTWSTCTAKNALDMMQDYDCEIIKLGLIRSYMTRHGPGPMPSESINVRLGAFERWNKFNEWQRDFRTGYADLMMWDYAIRANEGIDYLCISHLDLVGDKITAIERYIDGAGIDWFEIPLLHVENQLEHQAWLTDALFRCRGYQAQMRVLDIASILGTKVGIISRSEKASGKECFIK